MNEFTFTRFHGAQSAWLAIIPFWQETSISIDTFWCFLERTKWKILWFVIVHCSKRPGWGWNWLLYVWFFFASAMLHLIHGWATFSAAAVRVSFLECDFSSPNPGRLKFVITNILKQYEDLYIYLIIYITQPQSDFRTVPEPSSVCDRVSLQLSRSLLPVKTDCVRETDRALTGRHSPAL